MNTSTIEARRGTGRRLGVFILGLAVACAGAFSLSAAKADAAGVKMEFDKGAINLGAAFKGQQILPAPQVVSGARAAYWWDAADTGYATSAAKGYGDQVIAQGTPFNAAGAALYAPLSKINTCTTRYAASPAKPANLPSTAGPNEMFPCKVNPSGGTVGADQSVVTGATPCATLATTGCFSTVDGALKVRNWPGPINAVLPNSYPASTGTFQTAVRAVNAAPGGAAILPSIWGNPPWNSATYSLGDPATCAGSPASSCQGTVPLGQVDQPVPLSTTEVTNEFSAADNTWIQKLEIGANAFRFPLMVVPSPLDGSPVPITLAVKGAPIIPGVNDAGIPAEDKVVTGEYNPATGELSLEGALESRVLVGLGIDAVPESPPYPEDPPADQKGGPSPFVYCSVPLSGLTLNTTGASTSAGGFPGTPYYGGLDGEGAVAGTFNISADATPTVLEPFADPDKYTGEQAPDCTNVNNVVKGQGALWLGSGDVEAPLCEADQVGDYPNCKAAETKFAKPSIKVKKSVKAGKKIRATIRVKNNGTIEGTANVRLQTSNSKAKAPTLAVKVAADPGSTGRKTVSLKTKKRSKGKVTIYATVGGKTGKATVRVK